MIEKLKKASLFHRLFQGLVIILANHRCGIEIKANFSPTPIFKYEGGGIINRREIVISYSHFNDEIRCYDDFDPSRGYESKVTKETVEYLLNNFSWEKATIQKEIESTIPKEVGITKEELFEILRRFMSNPFGDPLRRLFEAD